MRTKTSRYDPFRDTAVLEGEGTYGVVHCTEDEPPKRDANAQAFYTEYARRARPVIASYFRDKLLRVIQNDKTPK